jgi:hypothetical protein
MIRPSESVPEEVRAIDEERRRTMNKSLHRLGTITTAAVLLSACSKDAHNETNTAAPATAGFEPNHEPGTGSVRAVRADFYLPCAGKTAGDECRLTLGGREIATQCVAMLDEHNETRLSCGSQRPPPSRSGGSPRTTQIDSYSPCNGKKRGDDCVLAVGTQQVRSHCHAMPDGASDARVSCGPPPPR